jgi:hypothetical protein
MQPREIIAGLLVAVASVRCARVKSGVGSSPRTVYTDQTCSEPAESSPTTWWRSAIDHNGTIPTAADSTYEYYRSAVQYGADNTGVQDSSGAFITAINGEHNIFT